MNFREYGEVQSVILTAENDIDLNEMIDTWGENRVVVDLQYSTCYDSDRRIIVYSALMLFKRK